jgi:hypothetical protein
MMLILAAALLALPATASAWVRPPAPAAKPFFDSRASARSAAVRSATSVARPSRETVQARAALERKLGLEGVISIDPLTGTPRQLMRTDGALSGPRAGARADIARDFVRANRTALGLSDADLDGLVVAHEDTTPRGLTVVRFQQVFRGIPAFDNDVRVAIDRAGRVHAVSGAPRHALSVPSIEPQLSGAEAFAALQRNVGVERVVPVRSGPTGVRQMTRFASGDFARLVLFGTADGARLAWHVTDRANSVALYDAVVDATTGAILYRQNLTKNDANADVYENHPGAAPTVAVDLEDFGLPAGATTLNGDWVHAWSDVDDGNDVDAGEEIPPSSGTDFVYPFTAFNVHPGCTAALPCAWDPAIATSWQTNREQNGVQAFYLVSAFHDHLADDAIAFDDDSGNFEVGGTGGSDPVLAQTDDGAATGPDAQHLNNANMSTPPDGQSPTMQMYLFKDSGSSDALDFRNINGGDDSGVVWHEYTHGLSNRLVTNADGSGALSTPHAGAMGEAWSDWYASDNQVREGLKSDDLATPGEIDVGAYSDLDPHTLRSQALDCPVGALDAACPGAVGTDVGGYTLGAFGKIAGVPEVHADGEIWAETLWDLRQRLQINLGSAAAASDVAEILVSDGMRVSPPEPSMLDMRNAILTADQIDFGGALHDLIWSVFRHRGMGYFAAATDGADTHPVEDFTSPPAPGTATGSVTGVVTNADSGLPIPGVLVGFGGHASRPEFDEFFAAVTDANGRYTITGVPVGSYPKLGFQASAGFDQEVARNVPISQDTTTVRNMAMRRDWSSLAGGAQIAAISDDTGADFGCGGAQALDQSQGTTWSAFNPISADPGNPHAGPPTLTIQLPATITVSAFLMDPSAGCGDGASATTRQFTIETSTNGTTFQTAYNGTGANEFTDANIGKLNRLVPTAANQNVRFVRVTLLAPLRVDPACAPDPCSGTDFIDLTEFEVLGGAPNVLPTGTLAVSPTTVEAGTPARFTASFTDPDSAITGYDWDFDGNGTVDQTTTSPTTDFAYAGPGTFTPKVTAKDFRGGGTAATATVKVIPSSVLPSVPRLADVGVSRARGSVSLDVTCHDRCAITAKLVVSRSLARRLGLKARTLTHTRATTSAERTVKLTIPKRIRRAARRAGLKSLTVTLTARATYDDGRRRLITRKLRIRV